MPDMLRWSLRRLPGGALQARVDSVSLPNGSRLDAFGYERKFKAMLAAFAPFIRLDLVIDSAGGLVDSAFGMARACLDCKRPVRVLIDGQCCSAATVVAFGVGAEVSITARSLVHLHEPRFTDPLPRRLRWLAMLKRRVTRGGMLRIYAVHTRAPRWELAALMAQGATWTAQEAVGFGWAKRIQTREAWEAMEDEPCR